MNNSPLFYLSTNLPNQSQVIKGWSTVKAMESVGKSDGSTVFDVAIINSGEVGKESPPEPTDDVLL